VQTTVQQLAKFQLTVSLHTSATAELELFLQQHTDYSSLAPSTEYHQFMWHTGAAVAKL